LAEEGERHTLFSYLENRFGISETLFNGYLLFKKKKSWWLLKNSPFVTSAARFKVSMVGVRAFQRIGGFVKPTTRLIQIFGPRATRARFEIDEGQLQNLMAGEFLPFDLELENGYVILILKGSTLGLGLLINGMIRSQIPRVGLSSNYAGGIA
jgi:NOL1/NOP2/fmu family ribosome biogenesis protein